MSGASEAVWIGFTFVGPDGYLRRTTILRDDLETIPQTPIEDRSGSLLRRVYGMLAAGMGLTVAGLADVQPRTQFANLETTEPPMPSARLLLWEFETEDPPSEADHGANIILAQNGPINNLTQGGRVRGPLRQPTGRPRTSVGASNAQPRPTTRTDSSRPPRAKRSIPQWLKDRFARGNANEARVRQEEGFGKNTRTVEGRDKNGNLVKTVPDDITPTQVIEVKDVKVLSNTRQIQAQASYAKTGPPPREYVVYVGENTHVTAPALATIRGAGGRVERLSYLGLGD